MQTLHISAAQVLHAAVAVGVAVVQDALVGARRCNRHRPLPFLAPSPNLSDAAEPTLAAALASGGESLNASKPDLRAQLATSTAAVSEPSRSRLGASL